VYGSECRHEDQDRKEGSRSWKEAGLGGPSAQLRNARKGLETLIGMVGFDTKSGSAPLQRVYEADWKS
jgi:hypothetical protein